jgi:hypothetical protein
VSTYARAILFIGRFCVAHLVKFRLKSTQKIVSVSITSNISAKPKAGNFYQYLCSEFYLEDKHFGADMPLTFLILKVYILRIISLTNFNAHFFIQ